MRIAASHAGWLLPALVALIYLPSLGFPFQFDDYNVIVNQPAVHSLDAWWRSMPGIRPLLKLSYALNWTLSPEPAAFRLVNIGLHAMNALLVWRILTELVRRRSLPPAVPLLAAALFAVHPIQTEAVTYVCGRSVSLMAFFYLLSLLAWLQAARSEHRARTNLKRLSALAFLCAFLTRETAIILPVALVLISGLSPETATTSRHSLAAPALRNRVSRTTFVRWLSGYRGPLTIVAMALAFLLALPAYRDFLSVSLAQRAPLDNLALQVDAVFFLTSHLLQPALMNADPGWTTTVRWDGLLAVRASLLALLIVLAFWSFRRRSFAGFCVLWFFLHLTPTNSLLPRLDIVNDRQLYLASIGAFAGFALAVSRVAEVVQQIRSGAGKDRRLGRPGWVQAVAATEIADTSAAVADGAAPDAARRASALAPLVPALLTTVLVTLAGWQTIERNRVYEDEIAFWRDVTAKSPQNARAFNNLGYAYQLANQPQAARDAYLRALTLSPSLPQARWNLELLLQQGDPVNGTADARP